MKRYIKSDATDDIITPAHSDYFDRLEDLLDKFNVQYRDSYVVNGGRIFYIEPGQVEFKHPNSGEYVPLLMAQLYADGSVYLSDKKYGGGWNVINVPLEEVFVDLDDGTYMNYFSEDKSINSSRQIESGLTVPAEEWAHRWIPNIIDQRNFISMCNEDGYTEFDSETFHELLDKYNFKANGRNGYLGPVTEHQIKSGMEFDELTEFSHQIAKSVISEEMSLQQAVNEVMNKLKCNEKYALTCVHSWIENEPTYNGMTMTSSRQIKSARYIATDPESGEVLGSADTYEEAVNEWGEDVTITDSEAAEGQQEEEGLFSSYEEETEEDDMEIESSKKPSGDKVFLSKIVSAFVSGSMTEEQAVKRVMLRNNCNIGYARQILSSAMDDASLIQSGTMEIAEDLNKDFNIDGDIESWSEDYVPQAGKANTIGGEILRATAQIVNRFYNDGDKIGIGNGKETVNPAARYILENAVEFTAVPDDLQAMLDNDSDINLSDESYEEWVDDFKYEVEDYLREHEELFHAPNKVDMWDFKQESDEKTPITDIFIEDDDGNRYSFQGGPEGWHCYDIYFADGPKYNVGDFVNSGDIQSAGGDTDEEFVTFNIDGYTYSAELYDNDEYEITDIESSNQLVHKDEEWTTEDLEKYNIYNSEDESELSIEDLY